MDAIPLVTGAQMQAMDRRTMASGVPRLDLMEAAGCGVADVLSEMVGGLGGRRLVFLCGKGNNGGDGFVAARWAAERGARVRVFLGAPPGEIQGEARINLGRISHLEPGCPSGVGEVRRALSRADAAIDALLGTGVRGPARGPVADLIEALEKASCPILAVDVPSGLNADTGRAEGPCAAASCTVTFAFPRLGHFFYPGRALCGRLHLIDIGIPAKAVRAEGIQTFLMDRTQARRWLPSRLPDAHKGDSGRVSIFAGSVGMTGAAALAGLAALRSGAGLVTLGVPRSLNDILETKVTEAMTCPLPEVRRARALSLRARGEICSLLNRSDAAAIGPGLGRHRETVALIRRIVRDLEVPAVLDADALNALAGDLEAVRTCKAPLILTPHPGEFSRLTGLDSKAIRRDPVGAARDFCENTGATVILKGAPTLIAGGPVYVNPTGHAGMATGGMGDVLTGLLAALLGQGMDPFQAACLGVYAHGLAADLAAEYPGHMGLTAGDLPPVLPRAFQQIAWGSGPEGHLHFREKAGVRRL